MKTAICFLMVIVAPVLTLRAQELNKKVFDERFQREVIVGYCDRPGLESDDEFGEYFTDEYEAYEFDAAIVNEIRKHRKNYAILLILGSWCGDSQEQVPRFLRILDEAHIKDKKLSMICVDGKKQCKEVDIKPYNIEFVPTIIFLRKGAEVGRIVETPENSLEKDMLNIIQ